MKKQKLFRNSFYQYPQANKDSSSYVFQSNALGQNSFREANDESE